MAIQSAETAVKMGQQQTSSRQALAAMPTGSVVATFDSRAEAAAAGVQILTKSADALVWFSVGRDASAAIRRARSVRSLVLRVLRGYGDEELIVREMLRQTDMGRSVLVIKAGQKVCGGALEHATHIYHLGVWTNHVIR